MSAMADISITALSEMIRRGEGEAALAQAINETQASPEDAEVWAVRAFVEDLLELFDAAETSITRAWTLNSSADLQFKRASIRLKAGHAQGVISDAVAVVKSGERFFYDEALLLSAEAKRRMGRWSEAMQDCNQLPEEAEVWSGGLIAARDIRAQCERMLGQRKVA